jgi:hypothetical protein
MPLFTTFLNEACYYAIARESVLFIGTQFSNLYTAVDTLSMRHATIKTHLRLRRHATVQIHLMPLFTLSPSGDDSHGGHGFGVQSLLSGVMIEGLLGWNEVNTWAVYVGLRPPSLHRVAWRR